MPNASAIRSVFSVLISQYEIKGVEVKPIGSLFFVKRCQNRNIISRVGKFYNKTSTASIISNPPLAPRSSGAGSPRRGTVIYYPLQPFNLFNALQPFSSTIALAKVDFNLLPQLTVKLICFSFISFLRLISAYLIRPRAVLILTSVTSAISLKLRPA
jgi:hypothetical protein